MCGIVGVADFAGRPVSRTLLEQSATLVQHRGPDGQGVWEEHQGDTHVGFGHQRLAVLDLRSCASQPMHNSGCVSQGTASPLALVFNGEIYNFHQVPGYVSSKNGLERQESAQHIHHQAQRLLAEWDSNSLSSNFPRQTTRYPFPCSHGNSAHNAITELLLHFKREVCLIQLKRIIDLRYSISWKFDVYNSADDLNNRTRTHVFLTFLF